ncbi:MAG: DUF1080 domain-containing protein [Carboxylicivirga sp.]|jgi:hypothetical protein|nr:DUF1080 domain-containing protein [Carboxylicivirga sp.]
MYLNKRILNLLLMLLIITSAHSQINRTLDTKVADLLVQMPAKNMAYRDKLMKDMLQLGPEVRELVCQQIVEPGTGDDTKARFAVESYSKFVSIALDKKVAKEWEQQMLKMIEKSSANEVKAFFIRQLEFVGSSASVESLSQYLNNIQLREAAIKSMLLADASKSAKYFSEALKNADQPAKISFVKALGQSGDASYAAQVAALYPQAQDDLNLQILKTLAVLPSAISEQLIMQQAKAARYNPNDEKAVFALLEYAKQIATGDAEKAMKIASTVNKKSSAVQVKSSALMLMCDLSDMEEKNTLLLGALKSKDNVYRGAAVEEAIRLKTPLEPWIKQLQRSKSGDVQKEILYLVSQTGTEANALPVEALTKSKDASVRKDALLCYAILKGESGLALILDFMAVNSSESDVNAAKQALLLSVGKKNVDQTLKRFDQIPAAGQVVLIETWGAKQYKGAFNKLISIIKNGGEQKSVALKNLALVSGGNDLPTLLSLFASEKTSNESEMIAKAIIAAYNQNEDKAAAKKKIFAAAKADQFNKFIPVYSAMGDEEAVQLVFDAYQKEKSAVALKALVQWSGPAALPALYSIAKDASSDKAHAQAFKGYVNKVKASDLPNDQKLLLMRKLMPLAKNDKEKKQILNALGSVKTYLNFIYLSKYLDDNALKNEAANAIVKVAMHDAGKRNGLDGEMIKQGLEKALPLITGPDSQYLKIDIETYLGAMSADKGYVSMFNGNDLSGWQGFVANPIQKKKLSPYKLRQKQKEADKQMAENWSVKNGHIVFNGHGQNLCSVKEYGDFEMLVDWRITRHGDSGIYLRGTPQVQVWDTSRVDVGAQVGSGGLYNNRQHESRPLLVADNPVGEWNTFRIRMVGERVTVYLNGHLVVDNVVMENYWDRSLPIFATGPIELQAHGTDLAFRDVYVRELDVAGYNLTDEEKSEGFVSLFNGTDLNGWIGNKTDYQVENGEIVIIPKNSGHGNLYTEKEYADFIYRFEFKLTPGANNGLGIRAPLEGDAAYEGMELQILDNTASVYANLKPYQYHGSVYGVIAAKRGYLKPVGEWNTEEVIVNGTRVKVILNGEVIVDGDIVEASANGTKDGKNHPGLKRSKGHIGFLGHGSEVYFRNIRIKEL